MKLKKILQDFSLTISSNLLTLIISAIIILVVPKIIGVYEYGLWQLYIFYSSYAGILHFGWLDGIYLRYGGKRYEDLNNVLFKSQFIFLLGSQVFFALVISSISHYLLSSNMKYILYSIAITIVIVNLKMFFQFILQMTNRIPEYAISNFITSLIYSIILVLLIISGTQNYQLFVLSYVIGQMSGLIYCAIICRDILFVKMKMNFKDNWNETCENITVGIKLVLSNIAGMLIIGIARFGIQQGWDVVTFGKISLVLSISNLLMVFVGAISLVLFPILRRVNADEISSIYSSLRDIMMPTMFLGMLVYFPIFLLIPHWLPKYDTALIYMSILFPMVVYQAKFEMLSNTFLKVLRMEKQLLFINSIVLILSSVLTVVTVKMLHNLSLTIFVIIVAMAMRSTISELFINSKLNTSCFYETVIESIMILVFMSSTWFFSWFISIVVYSVALLFYFLIKFTSIKTAIRNIRHT